MAYLVCQKTSFANKLLAESNKIYGRFIHLFHLSFPMHWNATCEIDHLQSAIYKNLVVNTPLELARDENCFVLTDSLAVNFHFISLVTLL